MRSGRARRQRDDRGALGPRRVGGDDPQRAGRARGARLPHAPAHVRRPDPDRHRLPQVRGHASTGRTPSRRPAPSDRRLLRRDDARPRGGPEGDDAAAVACHPVRGPGRSAVGVGRGDPSNRADRGGERADVPRDRPARPGRQGDRRPARAARLGRARRARSPARGRLPREERRRGADRSVEVRRDGTGGRAPGVPRRRGHVREHADGQRERITSWSAASRTSPTRRRTGGGRRCAGSSRRSSTNRRCSSCSAT